MRIFNCKKLKWSKKFLIAYIIVIFAAIISGIVLYKINNVSTYVYNFADKYIFFLFNFKNGNLFLAHFLVALFFFYLVFLLAYFTKLRFISLFFIFFRCVFFVLYASVMCCFFGTEGIAVVILVYVPSFVLWLAMFLFIAEQSRCLCSPISFVFPAIMALLNALLFLLMVNVIFRAIVVIV